MAAVDSSGEVRRRRPRGSRRPDIDSPPTPRGCEWRRGEDGWSLWRCWTETDPQGGKRVKRSRYAGHLSNEAWSVLKEYEYEEFLAIISQRLRRHGKR